MRTVIHGGDRDHDGRALDVIAHEPTDTDLLAVLGELAQADLRVEPVVDVFHTVHLWALTETTTEQEVQALRIVAKRTDARLAYHAYSEAVANG